MAKIKLVEAREILNAKGFPTIETTVILSDGKIGVASCPSGEKISHYEAFDLKDNDENRFEGQDVIKAVGNIKDIIAPQLIGKDIERLSELDRLLIDLDGTQNNPGSEPTPYSRFRWLWQKPGRKVLPCRYSSTLNNF